jgi:hypothetical protein
MFWLRVELLKQKFLAFLPVVISLISPTAKQLQQLDQAAKQHWMLRGF